MKHTQKMEMILEHLMQSMKTENRLRAPAELTTLLPTICKNLNIFLNFNAGFNSKILCNIRLEH